MSLRSIFGCTANMMQPLGGPFGRRNAAGAVEELNLLRDDASGVQAALTALGFTQPGDTDALYSLGGVFDAPIFVFYRNAESITQFAQFRGKRLSIGTQGTVRLRARKVRWLSDGHDRAR